MRLLRSIIHINYQIGTDNLQPYNDYQFLLLEALKARRAYQVEWCYCYMSLGYQILVGDITIMIGCCLINGRRCCWIYRWTCHWIVCLTNLRVCLANLVRQIGKTEFVLPKYDVQNNGTRIFKSYWNSLELRLIRWPNQIEPLHLPDEQAKILEHSVCT